MVIQKYPGWNGMPPPPPPIIGGTDGGADGGMGITWGMPGCCPSYGIAGTEGPPIAHSQIT